MFEEKFFFWKKQLILQEDKTNGRI